MTLPNQPGTDAPSGDTGGTPAATAPKLEVVTEDGRPIWRVDGKKVVHESDLMAAKESLTRQLNDAQTVHEAAIDSAKLGLSQAQQQLAEANAKLKDAQASQPGDTPPTEDVSKLKQELDAAKGSAEQASAKALELLRANIVLASGGNVKPEQLKDKTVDQLESFVEALKVVVPNAGGPGPYAVGAGGGGVTPVTPMDRAKALLESTPIRGIRNTPA